MGDDRTIDENAKTEIDAPTVSRPTGAVHVTRRSVGRFRIDAELGSGGMADVFRAYDPMLDRDVALKVLHSKLASDDARGVERVLREARAAAALTHPNTVTIYEVGEADGDVFIAMELLHGRVLRDVVADGDGASLEQKLRWLLQAARALEAAHARGLVHRDVKPENMFVCADGTLKLLDFGIAKRDDDTGEGSADAYPTGPSSLRTQAGRRFGTPRYMAPEQHAGRRTDARTDEYAWGLVAFELLCGSLVAGEYSTATAEDEAAPNGASTAMRSAELRSKVPELADDIIATIARATEPAQAARFSSMTPIVAAFARHTESAPPRGFPKSTQWVIAAAIVVGAIAVLLGIAIASVLRAPARVANRSPAMCRVTRLHTVAGVASDFIVPRADGALVTVHTASMAVSVAVVTPGGPPRSLLPSVLGGPDSKQKVHLATAEALTVHGDAEVLLGLGVMPEPDRNDETTIALLGSSALIATRHFREPPSGFAAVPFGAHAVGVATSKLLGPDPSVKVFTLGGPATEIVDVELAAAEGPAMAVAKDRFAIAYQRDGQIRFAVFGPDLKRFGDILTASKIRSEPALAFADDGKTAAIYYRASLDGKLRLQVSTLTLGQTAFRPPVTAIGDPLLDTKPFAVPLSDGASALVWLETSGVGITVRVSPIGPGGALIGATSIATAHTVEQLHATATTDGLTFAWNDNAGTTTVADVVCQLPVVRTPAR